MTKLPDDAGKGKGKTEATADRIKYLVEDEIQQQPYEFRQPDVGGQITAIVV